MAKKLRYALITSVLALMVVFSAVVSACGSIKTKHPRAKITVEFNSKTYVIEYTLYRNMYPQTVQHFIELADNGFYNDMIVHNYTSSNWFTGAYSYNGASEASDYDSAFTAGSSSVRDYLEHNSKEAAYYDLFKAGKLTPSVYKKLSYDAKGNEKVAAEDALPALIGEFSSNDHKIKKNPVRAEYGVLKMFYYPKGDTNQKVAIKNSFGQLLEHDYKYNCATSVFAMQVSGSDSAYGEANYCTFARLRNDGERDKFNSLIEAVSDYITDELDGASGDFTRQVSVPVDTLDTFADEGGQAIETSFSTTQKPLIIKSVKITKY